MERFALHIKDALAAELKSDFSGDLETPPTLDLGDFAYPCFKLAKNYRKAPPQIAKELVPALAKRLKSHPVMVSSAGPYINFTIDPKIAVSTLMTDILDGDDLGTYGQIEPKSRDRWILEYSSPNVAKPFHVGHLRTTALGASLDRMARFRGFDVISINHLGDWGTQYGKLAVAMELFGDQLPEQPGIDDLSKIYVLFHQAAEKDPSLEDRARDAFKKLEEGDPKIEAIWKQCRDISMKEFNEIYSAFDVHFDHVWGESFYQDKVQPLIEDLKAKHVAVESEGALVIPVEDENGKELPPCILVKKDGATIYATRDLAAAIYRHNKFNFDRMSYIVGAEQKLHFVQVFGALRKAGNEWVDRCEHIPFGLYRFKDAKMSSRKGNIITVKELLAEVQSEVKNLIQTRNEDESNQNPIDPSEIDEISNQISIGSILFFDLSSDPIKDVQFEIKRVVDFEGETGAYLQYAHTRCLSILRKSSDQLDLDINAINITDALIAQLKTEEEIHLVKVLGRFPVFLERSLQFAKASHLANYLIDVTKFFNTFYRQCRVIDSENLETTRARLLLVESTRRVLARGLSLLGIPRPARM